jgi:hypothetical protein
MRMRFTLSMQLEAWNSRGDLPTCHGTSREFVVKGRDGRLLAFGANL